MPCELHTPVIYHLPMSTLYTKVIRVYHVMWNKHCWLIDQTVPDYKVVEINKPYHECGYGYRNEPD